MKENEIVNGNHLVTKSNELIEAKYRMSLQEQRLVCILASKVSPEDDDLKEYTFNTKELSELLGLKTDGFYTELRKVTYELLGRRIQIKLDTQKILQTTWLSSALYDRGKVTLKFSSKLRPYLVQLKACFTSYRLSDVLTLKSKYAIRLYELARKNELLGGYIYELELLRDKLGVEKNELTRWFDFQKYVLDKAISEINEKTDLHVSYKVKKDSRKIVAVELHIQKQADVDAAKKPKALPEGVIAELIAFLPESHRTTESVIKAIQKAYRRHGKNYCQRNIMYAAQHAKTHFKGFLGRALEYDWGLPWWEDFLKSQELKVQKIEEDKAEKLRRQAAQIEKEEKEKTLQAKLEAMSVEARDALKEKIITENKLSRFFGEKVPDDIWQSFLLKDGFPDDQKPLSLN